MKNAMMLIAVAALAAGSAFANEGQDDSQDRKGKWNRQGRGAQMEGRGGENRPGGPMSPEMMQEMRDEHRAIKALADSARAETDEAKKAELVAQLRSKLGDVADRIQKHQDQRLAQAEERLAGLKERIEYAKTNRDSMIDEQLQRILSGERPRRHESFGDHPFAKGDRTPPPPPPGDDMEDMPPPPEED